MWLVARFRVLFFSLRLPRTFGVDAGTGACMVSYQIHRSFGKLAARP